MFQNWRLSNNNNSNKKRETYCVSINVNIIFLSRSWIYFGWNDSIYRTSISFPILSLCNSGIYICIRICFSLAPNTGEKEKKTPSHPIRITNDNEGNDSIIYILMQTLSIIHSPIRIIHEQIERNQMENLSNARIKMFSSRSSRIENVISFNFACLFILNRSVWVQ